MLLNRVAAAPCCPHAVHQTAIRLGAISCAKTGATEMAGIATATLVRDVCAMVGRSDTVIPLHRTIITY